MAFQNFDIRITHTSPLNVVWGIGPGTFNSSAATDAILAAPDVPLACLKMPSDLSCYAMVGLECAS